MGRLSFFNADHLQTLGEERIDGQKNRGGANEAKLKGLVKDLKITNMRLILQAQTQVPVWAYAVLQYQVQYDLLWDFGISYAHITMFPCGPTFRYTYTLSCITGVLVIARHNNISDKILYLARLYSTPASLCPEPLIQQGRIISEKDIYQGSENEK